MKKLFLCSALLCLFAPAVLFSQNECGTPASPPPPWIFNPSLKALSTQTAQERTYMLKIFIHIIRKTDGSGGVGTGALTAIPNILNSAFGNTGILFYLSGHEYIDSDQFYIELTEAEESLLFATNTHSDAIDIYVLGSSTYFDAAGSAQAVPSTAMIIQGSYYNQSTLPHEMGHCLGLYHTHHGTYEEVNRDGSNPDPSQCAELVNGSNSTTCGDYIADTPADPKQWSTSNCNYTGTGKDDNNQPYSPSAANYMSYAYKSCRNMFTPLQAERMLDFIENTPALQAVIIPHITGPFTICPGTSATFTVQNWQNSQTIEWLPGPYLTGSGSGSAANSATYTASGNGASWIDVRINGTPLGRFDIWVGKPPYITGYRMYGQSFDYGYTPGSISVCPGEQIKLFPEYLKAAGPVLGYEIQTVNCTASISTTGCILFKAPARVRAEFMIDYRYRNECGWSEWIRVYGRVMDCAAGEEPFKVPVIANTFISYPNPASNILNIEIDPEAATLQSAILEQTTSAKQLKQDKTFDIRLYDGQGNLLRQKKTKGGTVQFNVSSLPAGIYYLHIYDGVNGTPEMRQIVVEH